MLVNPLRVLNNVFKNNKNDPMHNYDGEWTAKCVSKVTYWADEELDSVETKYIRIYSELGYELTNSYKLPKKEIKYNMEHGLLDQRIKDKFYIEDMGFGFRIQYTENGKRKQIVRKYGKRVPKKSAFEKITEERENLFKLSFG